MENEVSGNTNYSGYVNAGATLVSSLLGMFGSNHANQKQYEQQLALLDKQHQFSREMWEDQKKVNSTSILNQLNQFQQAGINPLAVAGGLSPAIQSAPSAPSAPMSQYHSPLEGANVAVMMSEALRNIAEAKKTEAEVPKIQSETAFTWSQQQTVDALRDKQVEALGVTINLDNARYHLTEEDMKRITAEIDFIGKRKEEIDANIRNSTVVANAEYWNSVNNWIHNRALEQHWTVEEQQNWKRVANEVRQVSAYIQDVNSLCEQRRHLNDLTDAQKGEVEQRTANLKKEGEKLGYEVDFEKNTVQWKTDAENMRLELQYAADQGQLLITNEQTKYNREHRSTIRDVHAVEQVLSPFKQILAIFGIAFGVSKGSKSGLPAGGTD